MAFPFCKLHDFFHWYTLTRSNIIPFFPEFPYSWEQTDIIYIKHVKSVVFWNEVKKTVKKVCVFLQSLFQSEKYQNFVNLSFGIITYQNQHHIIWKTCMKWHLKWTHQYQKYTSSNIRITLHHISWINIKYPEVTQVHIGWVEC